MAKVDGSISSLIQGVSQQPERERLPGQCTLQENFSSDPVNGLTRRGPTEFIKKLVDSAEDYIFQEYDAGSIGNFVFAHTAGTIKAFDLDGTEYTVTPVGDAADYIPSTDLVYLGIDDKIYVADPTVTTAMLPDTRDYVENAAMVFALGGQYGRTYKVTVKFTADGAERETEATYTTPDGSSPAHIINVGTTFIIEKLYNALMEEGSTAFDAARVNLINAISDYNSEQPTATTCTAGAPGDACNVSKEAFADHKALVLSRCNALDSQVTTPYADLTDAIDDIRTAATAENLITSALTSELNTQSALYNEILERYDFANFFEVFRQGDVLYIKWLDASRTDKFSVLVDDGDGGSNLFAVNNAVRDVGELPRYAPQGYIIRVSESGGTGADDWYLEFVSTDTDAAVGEGFGTDGKWVETVAPDTTYLLDTTTMPHVLEKTGATSFDLKAADWSPRAVGDDTTNPLPSFVGNKINDLSVFQGRMALTADVNLVMSRTNKHTNFFNNSATTLSDDDPIDISSALGTYVLRKIVPHNRDLVIFSDNAQFIVFGRNSLTPQNSSLVLTTEFESDLTAKPVGAGRNVFFSFKYGNFSGLQEFFTEGGEDINDSRPITQHVLQYVKGKATQLVSSTNFNKLLVRTDVDPKLVYVYEYIWVNRQKAQSSWSTWKFAKDVKHMFFVDNLLYLITKAGTDYEMYTLNLDNTPDTGVGYKAELDDKIIRSPVSTTFEVPYDVADITDYICVQGADCPNPGMRATIASYAADTVTLVDDMGGGTVVFGRKYTSRYIPTAPFVRDREGVKVGSGKLTIKQYTIYFNQTGFLKAIVTDDYGYSKETKYNGRVLGAPNNLVGEPAVSEGFFQVPYKKNAEGSQLEIKTDSHLPLSLSEMEWKGQWRKKGKRITGG